jgi:two-component system, NarL family, sensor kinase
MKIAFILAFVLKQTSPDSVQAEKFFQRYQDYQYRNYDSALLFLDRSADVLGNAGRRKRQAEVIREKGTFLKDNGRFEESLAELNKALRIFSDLKDELAVAATYNSIGVTYWRSGDNINAFAHYVKSRDLNRKLRNKPGLVRNHIALGNYFARQHAYHDAIENFEEARKLCGPEEKSMRALVLKNTGNVYNDENFPENNSETAVEYYQQSLIAYRELADTINIAGLHVNIGLIYENKGNLQSAVEEYSTAIGMQNRASLKADVVYSYLNLGNALLKLAKISQAREALLKGIRISEEIKNGPAYRNLTRKISQCYEAEGNFSRALLYLHKYDSVDETLYNKQRIETQKELETKYQTEKKQAEINLRIQQRDYIMITLIVTLLLTIIIVLIYSQRQKVIAQLRERDKILMNNKVDELLRDTEIKSLRAFLSGQDEERRRVATDLHDRLGSTLSAVKLYFSSVKDYNDQNQSLTKAGQLLDHAVDEVREISHNLLAGSIDKFGLATALEELKETINESNKLKMDVLVHGIDARLDNDIELQLYRIIQELVSNILKHADASEVTVQLNKSGNELNVTVEDNGRGFDPSLVTSNGIGLKNIESRVQSLDGSVRVDSSQGKGTTVLLNIPLS